MVPEPTVLDCLLGGDPAEVCGEPYCATVTFACVHEHIDAARMCSGCALEIQMLAGSHTCPRCEDGGPESHECRCRVVITWDDQTAPDTIVQEATDERQDLQLPSVTHLAPGRRMPCALAVGTVSGTVPAASSHFQPVH